MAEVFAEPLFEELFGDALSDEPLLDEPLLDELPVELPDDSLFDWLPLFRCEVEGFSFCRLPLESL